MENKEQKKNFKQELKVTFKKIRKEELLLKVL